MLALTPVLLVGLVVLGPGESTTSKSAIPPVRTDLLSAPHRRVRSTDRRIQALIAEGVRRSHTFSQLLAALDRTDVIVYVEQIRKLPPTIAGRLLLVSVSHGQRYLRIQLGTGGTTVDAISTLAHELQHALEIGAVPDVRDQDALARLYQRIGEAGVGAGTYDTRAARDAGRLVRLELAS
jgi:hypothetical protein